MSLVVFEVRSSIGHFRRPDTLGTHASYPFMTRTALRGLAASVLGRESIPESVRCGLRLLSPVRSVAQELSLLGKTWQAGSGKEESFNRPTSIELLVEPHYRIYYHGELAQELASRLRAGRSGFHTYLGSAFCLTFPRFREWLPDPRRASPGESGGQSWETAAVAPSEAVSELVLDEHREYARVGGLLYRHIGGRRFRGSVSLLYERSGKSIRFLPNPAADPERIVWVDLPEEGLVCLW
ncbi:MAG TPA: CRISPR-associated protein Cas5 [Acidobacteriota bacterium]|nr:CRISPR-associated protein Cas5 [Acidobacteriota bacterium]